MLGLPFLLGGCYRPIGGGVWYQGSGSEALKFMSELIPEWVAPGAGPEAGWDVPTSQSELKIPLNPPPLHVPAMPTFSSFRFSVVSIPPSAYSPQ